MQFRQKRSGRQVISLTNLVDVLFLLLTFFVVNTTFNEYANIRLDLPTTRHARASTFEEGLVLHITKDGRLFLLDQPIEKEELEGVLRQGIKEQKDQGLVLKADKEVHYGIVIYVMDIARGVGFRKITTLTLPEEGRP